MRGCDRGQRAGGAAPAPPRCHTPFHDAIRITWRVVFSVRPSSCTACRASTPSNSAGCSAGSTVRTSSLCATTTLGSRWYAGQSTNVCWWSTDASLSACAHARWVSASSWAPPACTCCTFHAHLDALWSWRQLQHLDELGGGLRANGPHSGCQQRLRERVFIVQRGERDGTHGRRDAGALGKARQHECAAQLGS